jgi:hypothetical protein
MCMPLLLSVYSVDQSHVSLLCGSDDALVCCMGYKLLDMRGRVTNALSIDIKCVYYY